MKQFHKWLALPGAAAVLCLQLVLGAAAAEPLLFRDVDSTSPWYDGVVFAVEHGISQGTGEDTFSPDAPITIQQWAVMLCRAYGLDVETLPDTPFGEAELSQAYREGWLDMDAMLRPDTGMCRSAVYASAFAAEDVPVYPYEFYEDGVPLTTAENYIRVGWENGLCGENTVTVTDKDGNKVEQEETYTVAVPITDLETIWSNVSAETGLTISAEQKRNADSIYNLVLYGSSTGMEGWIPGADVPYIGADGFCSPIGSGWQSRVTSEFGYRKDPFTGETRGHTGMDLSVPTGTPVRAALSGTITVSQYNSSYGYYVVVDHGNGLSTLYAHNSKLLVRVGQTVEAGDVVSLSGSTGRSTGPHLHFEVRVNGERTNPRYYLPT